MIHIHRDTNKFCSAIDFHLVEERNLNNYILGTSLAVQCLRLSASTAGGTGLIPGWGTKILHALQRGQKKKKLHFIALRTLTNFAFTHKFISPFLISHMYMCLFFQFSFKTKMVVPSCWFAY